MEQMSKKLVLTFYWISCFTITHIPGWWLPPATVGANDKVIHGCMYLGLTLLVFYAFNQSKSLRTGLRVLGILIIYAALDEGTQPWVDRHADWLDFLADTLGILLGTTVYLGFDKLMGQANIKNLD